MSTGAGAKPLPGGGNLEGARDARAPSAEPLLRILCVDDEPAILVMLERALGSEFEVICQSDPEAALELVEPGRFAVVISDMKMPGMLGDAFLEQVKQRDPHTTRIALTAGLDWQLPPETAFGILTKPVTLPLLRATVSAAAQFHALAKSDLRASRHSEPLLSHSGLVANEEAPLVESGLRPRRPVPSASPERGAQMQLSLLGTRVELWPRATLLGRALDCDVVVRDERLAPRHLRFFSSWRGVTVQDISGTNGVRLNGEWLEGVQRIQPGDCIDLGAFEIRVEALPSPGR